MNTCICETRLFGVVASQFVSFCTMPSMYIATKGNSHIHSLNVIRFRWWWRGTTWLKTTTSWWRHQKETFSALLAICAGNSPVLVNSPHKGQWRGSLMFSLICVWINGWVNNGEAGDLRRNRTHYDVTVMMFAAVTISVKPCVISVFTLCIQAITLHYIIVIITWKDRMTLRFNYVPCMFSWDIAR